MNLDSTQLKYDRLSYVESSERLLTRGRKSLGQCVKTRRPERIDRPVGGLYQRSKSHHSHRMMPRISKKGRGLRTHQRQSLIFCTIRRRSFLCQNLQKSMVRKRSPPWIFEEPTMAEKSPTNGSEDRQSPRLASTPQSGLNRTNEEQTDPL